MDKKAIIKKYPSLCWDCRYARNVAPSLLEKGICGCIAMLVKEQIPFTEENRYLWYSFMQGIECEGYYSGWVYNTRAVFDKEDASMVNLVLQTKGCKKCKYKEIAKF